MVDDILDYEAGEGTLGKPGGADLRLGLATGPALYAWEEHAAMGPMIMRKFKQEGDVELVSLPFFFQDKKSLWSRPKYSPYFHPNRPAI